MAFDSKNALNHAIKYLTESAHKRAAGGWIPPKEEERRKKEAAKHEEKQQKLLSKQYPTHYMPEVGRQVMASGGEIDHKELQKAAHAGRNGDTMLAHINPQEAELLKELGGSGTINPETGLPQFDNPSMGDYGGGMNDSGSRGLSGFGGGSSPSGVSGGGFSSADRGGGGGGYSSVNGGDFTSRGGGGGGGRDSAPSIGGGGSGMGIGIPSGPAAFGRPAGGVSSGLGFDPNSGAAAGEMSPIAGGYQNMALGSNIGGEMLGQALQSGSAQNFSPVGSGMSNFNISGAAPQAGFGDKPSMVAGSAFGPAMTIGGSLGAAQVEAMRSGSDWSNQYDPTGVSRGIAMGQQLAQPTSAAREANVPPATGMYGQPPMGTTTFGQMPRQSGFPTQTGIQDPSQAAYAEQMAKTARESYLAQNFPESPRLGDLAQPTPAAPFAIPDRAGSIGSMPTTYEQPSRPVTPTPFSGYSQDVQREMIPTQPDSAFRTGMQIDPTGAQTQEALGNMGVATDAVTMMNAPGLAGSFVRAFMPSPTEATPQQQAAIERMYQGTLEGGVPADFATSEGMAARYGAAGATPLAHPGQAADAYLSAGPSASTGRQDMPVSRPSAVGAGTPLAAYERGSATQEAPATSVRSNFNNAFAEARARGDQTFEWTNPLTGKTSLYTTQLARKEGGRVPSMANPDDWLAHVKVDTPKGKKREHHGSKPLPVDYGHIAGTKGADGMDVDAFVGPNKSSKKAFVINQQHPETKKFDEHKIMLGFDNKEQAMDAYRKSYPTGLADRMARNIISAPAKDAVQWAKSGKTSQPVDKNTIVNRAVMLSSKKS